MFTAPTTPGLASEPRKGIGARVASGFSRLGGALRSVVAGGLRRPQSGPDSRATPDSRTASDADGPAAAAARPARAPRRPGRAHTGVLTRLFRRRRKLAVVPEQSGELPNADFTEAAFPELSPEARAFFNTPVEQCDPDLLCIVLEALVEFIARELTPQEGMQDSQDMFLALRARLAAVRGEAEDAPPAALAEVAAAPPADLPEVAAAPGLPPRATT